MPKKKLIMFGAIGLAVLLLAGGGFFAYKKFFAAAPAAEAETKGKEEKGKHEAKGKEEKGKEGEAKGKEGEGGKEKGANAGNEFMGPTTTLTFVVNLADPGRPRYLKLNIEMEMENESTLRELEAIKPKVRDSIITLLSSHGSDTLNSVADKQKLKEEILHRLNSLMTSGKVREVYFSDFMVQ